MLWRSLCFASGTADPLAPWFHAVRSVQRARILPSPHAEGSDDANVLALLGDALLKVAVFRELGVGKAAGEQRQSVGALTQAANAALTNSRMAALGNTLLVRPGLLSQADWMALPSDHTRATAVEAASAAAMEAAENRAAGEEALRCVARELLVGLLIELPPSPVSAKTRLLELGGTVESERKGGPDHSARWRAVARRGASSASATDSSRRAAEATAAGRLLREAGIELREDGTVNYR